MRLIARFAQEQKEYFEVITVYEDKRTREFLEKENPELLSISKSYPSAIWFEQKISDDFGIKILHSTHTPNFVKHKHLPSELSPLQKSFSKIDLKAHGKEHKAKKNTHKILLGPTHTFSLESSQFSIEDDGSSVIDFKLIPFSKYRGIEKMVEGLTLEEARSIVERISAPLTVAYQSAWLDILLQASGKALPETIKKRHYFLLELERVTNHLQDLALLCKVVKFEEGDSFFHKFIEYARVIMKSLTGHRLGFNAITLEENASELEDIENFLLHLEKELTIFQKWIQKNEKHLSVMKLTGVVSKELVESYGLVGIVARASGLERERRVEDKFYTKNNFTINTEEGGDAYARFTIRISEILTSLKVMHNLGQNNHIPFFMGTASDGEYYSFVESSAGELMMYVSLENGVIERFYVRDPSFLNAQALPLMLKDIPIEKVGLMLKSIPLNMSAIDL